MRSLTAAGILFLIGNLIKKMSLPNKYDTFTVEEIFFGSMEGYKPLTPLVSTALQWRIQKSPKGEV